MFAHLRDVLSPVRQEIQRIKDLKVPLRTGQQVVAGRLGKAPEPVVPSQLEERLARELGQREKGAIRQEHAFGNQSVNMRMPMDQVASPKV